jgi:CRP-like cAMP-binding protein
MADLERLLADHPFSSGMAEPQLASLRSVASLRDFAAAEFLLREGDEAEVMYLMTAGRAVFETHVPGKETIVVGTALPGDIVGLSWLFPPARVHLDVRASEAVVAIAFAAQELRALMDRDHDLGYALTRRLLRVTYDRLEKVRIARLDLYRI